MPIAVAVYLTARSTSLFYLVQAKTPERQACLAFLTDPAGRCTVFHITCSASESDSFDHLRGAPSCALKPSVTAISQSLLQTCRQVLTICMLLSLCHLERVTCLNDYDFYQRGVGFSEI